MYSRPALAEIVQRVSNDVLSRLAADDVLRRADAEVYSRVLAGVAHGLYGFIDWLSQQVIYDTAEVEFLERWCSIWGISRKPAAAATGEVTFAVLAGSVIPAGTLLQALDGVQYETTAEATVTAPTATAPIVAVVPAAAGNRVTGQALSLVSPVVGVQPTATAGELTGGADIEADTDLRALPHPHPPAAARWRGLRLSGLGAGGSRRHPCLGVCPGAGPRHGHRALRAR